MRRQRRIPTILALLLLVLGIGGVVSLVQWGPTFFGQEARGNTPKEVHISNVTDSSVTISWLTDGAVDGRVEYGDDSNKKIKDDDRQVERSEVRLQTHYVTIRDLAPLTNYSFRIISGGKKFDQDGKPFTLVTGATIVSLPTQSEPAYGKVIGEDNQPAAGAMVYLTIGDSSLLSTLVKPSGEWLIPITTARTADGRSLYKVKPGEQAALTIRSAGGKLTAVTTDVNHYTPLPPITIGNQYDFLAKRKEETVSQNWEEPVVTPQVDEVAGKKTLGTTASKKVAILVPEDEGALTTTKPLFRGTGISGKTVAITVESTPQVGVAVVSSDGTWSWSPPQNLEPGNHTVTIRTSDDKGNEIVKAHTFTVLKSGTQVLGEATPSATLTPTPSATPSATPTVKLSPTATPSAKLPRSGHVENTFAMLGIGAVLFFIGTLRLFRTNVF